ncbi:response regulator aspartate phosphatase [Bacillus subtilis]|nr:response regulator aspartate phosphatase [Bacillus subtilis]
MFSSPIDVRSLEPPEKKYKRPSISELLEKIENRQKRLTGLLKYYSLFFRGMYEFDQKDYVEAIHYYREALHKAEHLKGKQANRIIGVIHHNLGLVSTRGGNLTDAEYFFRRALEMKDHMNTANSIRTLYMMANVIYQSSKLDEAHLFYEKALKLALHFNEEEYNEKEVERSLKYSEKKCLWSEYAELTEKIGDFHFETGNFTEGRNFLKRNINAQTQILKVTEVL